LQGHENAGDAAQEEHEGGRRAVLESVVLGGARLHWLHFISVNN
jgi:hypothetical protein